MSPEEKARLAIDQKLIRSGWVIQDMKNLNLFSAMGVAVREFPTSTGEVDYALFVDGTPIGIVEAKRTESGEKITTVEDQSARYAGSKFKWIKGDTAIRFAYEATDKLTRFTDYHDLKYCSRTVFSFHRPETLRALLSAPDTIRNNMKHFPPLTPPAFVTAKFVPSASWTALSLKTGRRHWCRWPLARARPLPPSPPHTAF